MVPPSDRAYACVHASRRWHAHHQNGSGTRALAPGTCSFATAWRCAGNDVLEAASLCHCWDDGSGSTLDGQHWVLKSGPLAARATVEGLAYGPAPCSHRMDLPSRLPDDLPELDAGHYSFGLQRSALLHACIPASAML